MTKHLILEFLENPVPEEIDLDSLEYDTARNLTIIKGTTIPAVNFDQQGTLTQTKSTEGTDSDFDSKFNNILMATATHTRVHNEAPDDDPRRKLSLNMATATKTFTETESTDSDRDLRQTRFIHKLVIKKQ